MDDLVRTDLERIEHTLHQCVTGAGPLIDELTSHLSRAGGKRMRPMLSLLCAQLGAPGETANQQVINAATAVELTHLATLYHDDVMDSAPQRRGVPAAQHQWGNNRAILAGDVLFARASRLVAPLGQDSIDHHARTFERLCAGQLNETFGPGEGDDPVEFYLQVLADKTGSLIQAAAVFGSWHSGAPREYSDAVGTYGERIGVAFQLADDVIDLTSDAEVSGKTPGTDLLEGVVTLPILLLQRKRAGGNLDAAGTRLLEEFEDGIEDEQLADVVARLSSHEVVEETRNMARKWADDAVAALEPLPEGAVKEALVQFAALMVDRMN
ncbi:MAG: polyprenyl synthetase family protein [Actinomycetaceae bacterium]|nr:polyprenyl synthetase family protein [Actinomycetaceae bacterium]